MKPLDPRKFHRLFGAKTPRINFQRSDFIDYALMTCLTVAVIYAAYGPRSPLSCLGYALCGGMIISFLIRHGARLALPIVLRRPQDAVYLFVYKILNMTPMYVFSVVILLVQQLGIHLTPGLPHHVLLMREIAIDLFYFHLTVITLYRTVSLVHHLRRRTLVTEVLGQTAWRGQLLRQPRISVEILHAYLTGLLTHLVLLAPWYFVIQHVQFSVVFLPVVLVINFFTHIHYLKSYNAWFYRDHWLGHNSELEFLYLHGTHHDAIPSGLIGVSGNGFLEGFLRHTLGHPTPFYSPVFAFLLYTLEVQSDIQNHQYIPGIFPKVARRFHEMCQHSTHHFGRLEPYGVAVRELPGAQGAAPGRKGFQIIPDEILNSIELDEQLTAFRWDNPRYQRFLELFDRYQR